MRVLAPSLAFLLSVVALGCATDTSPPPITGDLGDTSGTLKVGCTLSRDGILASVQGGRKTAIERGFAWYDAQVPYSQSQQYGGYRTDCSGFVSMCWELGTSYTTASFVEDGAEWSSLGSFDELVPADAMVYRSGKSGHIVMFVGWNDAAKTEACVLEQASTADDMQFRARTVDSLVSGGYHAIRASKFGAAPTGKSDAPQCYCDADCASYGDCCAACSGGSGAGGSSGGGSGGAGGGGGASGGGSGGGEQCYCDSSCSYYNDCCAACGGGSGSGGSGGGSAGSAGSAGSGGEQCYCDAWCWFYGDCCASC